MGALPNGSVHTYAYVSFPRVEGCSRREVQRDRETELLAGEGKSATQSLLTTSTVPNTPMPVRRLLLAWYYNHQRSTANELSFDKVDRGVRGAVGVTCCPGCVSFVYAGNQHKQ